MAHRDTFFHLIPQNDKAREVLDHSDNRRFASLSTSGDRGLEIGFHVSRVPGRVMARIGRGRAADIALQGRDISSVHIAFELHPETKVVLLSVRAKNASSVTVKSSSAGEETVEGDYVFVYAQGYHIHIATYEFQVIWSPKVVEDGKKFALREFRKALEREENARSRDLPTEGNSTLHTWHNTRIHTANRPLFREAPVGKRERLGDGAFGDVYKAVDFESGMPFAIKVIKLAKFRGGIEYALSVAHSEVKMLERLKHGHIIKLLGSAKWDTNLPEKSTRDLEYVSRRTSGHFGLARREQSALHFGGTWFYLAPELIERDAPQSPKMDVWSLFATLIDVHPGMDFPPPPSEIYNDVLNAIQTAARNAPQLANMVRKDPRERASAAQMLVALFDGHGLTTLMSEVPPLTTAPIPVPATAPVPAAIRKPTPAIPHAGPSKSPTAKVDKVPAEVLPAKKDLPLIQYPRSPRKRQGGLPKLARAGGAAASPERMFDFDNPGMRGGMAARGSFTKPAMLASPA